MPFDEDERGQNGLVDALIEFVVSMMQLHLSTFLMQLLPPTPENLTCSLFSFGLIKSFSTIFFLTYLFYFSVPTSNRLHLHRNLQQAAKSRHPTPGSKNVGQDGRICKSCPRFPNLEHQLSLLTEPSLSPPRSVSTSEPNSPTAFSKPTAISNTATRHRNALLHIWRNCRWNVNSCTRVLSSVVEVW